MSPRRIHHREIALNNTPSSILSHFLLSCTPSQICLMSKLIRLHHGWQGCEPINALATTPFLAGSGARCCWVRLKPLLTLVTHQLIGPLRTVGDCTCTNICLFIWLRKCITPCLQWTEIGRVSEHNENCGGGVTRYLRNESDYTVWCTPKTEDLINPALVIDWSRIVQSFRNIHAKSLQMDTKMIRFKLKLSTGQTLEWRWSISCTKCCQQWVIRITGWNKLKEEKH